MRNIKAIAVTLLVPPLILSLWFTPRESARAELSVRSPDMPGQVIVSDSLALLTLNVAHGRGTALNQLLVSGAGHRDNLKGIATTLVESGAHVVALQEADAPSLWSGRFDHVDFLARETGYAFSVHGYHADAWPFTYGAALISRYQLDETASHRFQPSWPTATKGFVHGTVQWRGPGGSAETGSVTIASVHLDFSRRSVRDAQIEELIRELGDLPTPLVVMGDFNADWVEDDSPVRALARGLGLHAFMPMDGKLGTYKDDKRLDWILISNDLVFVDYEVVPDIISDHLAVVARVRRQEGFAHAR